MDIWRRAGEWIVFESSEKLKSEKFGSNQIILDVFQII